jgi:hypothetical protein
MLFERLQRVQPLHYRPCSPTAISWRQDLSRSAISCSTPKKSHQPVIKQIRQCDAYNLYRKSNVLTKGTLGSHSFSSLTNSNEPPGDVSNKIKNAVATSENLVKEASDYAILRTLGQYIWPKNDWDAKFRVTLAMAFLIAGKLLNVQVPSLFKEIVDRLSNLGFLSPTVDILTVAGTLLLGCTQTFSKLSDFHFSLIQVIDS